MMLGVAPTARLRRERAEGRARHAARDDAEARGVCRYLGDDRDAVRACEDRASAVYEQAWAPGRHTADAAREPRPPRPVGAD